VAAAVEAEVLPGDANPLEVLRGRQHPFDQRPVAVLELAALDQGPPCLGGAVGKLVAQRLQLAEVEDARFRGDGLDSVGNLGMAESLAEERGQLGLEASDLLAQLLPRVTLVDGNREPAESVLLE